MFSAMTKLIIFCLITAGLAWFSRHSLANRRAHGFYRFFAFETLLVLILANIDFWFHDPFSWNQIVSWIFLLSSLALAVHGFYLLRVIGKPQGDFENTTRLVRIGAYRYIRHPLYSSLVVLTPGVFFKDPSVLGILLWGTTTLFLYATARTEESENTAKFGEEYAEYMQSTRMFIPYLF
ncbi:MAG TPA: isoprenylcysteine carboxylmethyltransferase family protein [Bacteroidota bacterium]